MCDAYSDLDAIIGEDEGCVGGRELGGRHFCCSAETETGVLCRCAELRCLQRSQCREGLLLKIWRVELNR